MQQLSTGEFFGQSNQAFHLNGLTLTETIYTHDFVDWHYHENAYFTWILQGRVIEKNKKETHHCISGGLLFHNSEEQHFNIKPPGFTKGFHVELNSNWFDRWNINISELQGSLAITDVEVKLLLHRLFQATRQNDQTLNISADSLVIQMLCEMKHMHDLKTERHPAWVNKVKEILTDEFDDKITLEYLATNLNIHPVHLSRSFPKYFKCNIGEYIRKLKLEKSITLLSDKQLTLTEIGYRCGYSDQSHFVRNFKSFTGISPKRYRNLI